MSEDKKLEVVEENKNKEAKEKLKQGLREIISNLITSIVLGIVSALSSLLNKINVKKENETRWGVVAVYLILISALTIAINYMTEYSAEITQVITEIFNL